VRCIDSCILNLDNGRKWTFRIERTAFLHIHGVPGSTPGTETGCCSDGDIFVIFSVTPDKFWHNTWNYSTITNSLFTNLYTRSMPYRQHGQLHAPIDLPFAHDVRCSLESVSTELWRREKKFLPHDGRQPVSRITCTVGTTDDCTVPGHAVWTAAARPPACVKQNQSFEASSSDNWYLKT
jgi:hypothetical protein